MGWEECCLVPQVLVYRGSIIIASRRDIGGVAIDKIQDVDGCILENTAIYASLRTPSSELIEPVNALRSTKVVECRV